MQLSAGAGREKKIPLKKKTQRVRASASGNHRSNHHAPLISDACEAVGAIIRPLTRSSHCRIIASNVSRSWEVRGIREYPQLASYSIQDCQTILFAHQIRGDWNTKDISCTTHHRGPRRKKRNCQSTARSRDTRQVWLYKFIYTDALRRG
jgi:hypothetical protein